jgi:hypothetical protein
MNEITRTISVDGQRLVIFDGIRNIAVFTEAKPRGKMQIVAFTVPGLDGRPRTVVLVLGLN